MGRPGGIPSPSVLAIEDSTNRIVPASVNKGELGPGTGTEHACFILLVTPSHLIADDGNGAEFGSAARRDARRRPTFQGVTLFAA